MRTIGCRHDPLIVCSIEQFMSVRRPERNPPAANGDLGTFAAVGKSAYVNFPTAGFV